MTFKEIPDFSILRLVRTCCWGAVLALVTIAIRDVLIIVRSGVKTLLGPPLTLAAGRALAPLLQTRQLLVGEVVQHCGYESHSRFSAVFRSRYGFLPSHLRSA